MAAQSVVPFTGSKVLAEHAANMQRAREAKARREQSANFQKSFAAAQLNRLTTTWRATAERIDDELRSDLDALRARSRTLENNNDYFRNYLDIVETNLIGENAPRLVPLADNAPGSPDQGARDAILAAWDEWGQMGNCEVTGQYSFAGLCQSIARGTARDGEYVVIPVIGNAAGNKWGYALQVIDVDRLATWLNRDASEGLNAISAGVEVNGFGRPVAYHFNKGNQATRQTEHISASSVLHRFIVQRPEQKRGIPWGHASMLSMHYAGEFALSALMAAKFGADHLGFFVTPDGEAPRLGGDDSDDESGNKIATSAPGTWDTLPTGVDVKTVDSKYPNEVFGPFIKTANQRMASGLPGASYPELCNDYEAVNFSSIRAAILSARDEWKKRQKWFSGAWLDPIFSEWLRMSLLNGAILLANGSPLPLAKLQKFKAHAWQFRGWAWVDPLKDIQAAKEALYLKITSRKRVAAEQGRDLEEVFDEIQTEAALARKYGVDLTPADQPKNPPATANQEPI